MCGSVGDFGLLHLPTEIKSDRQWSLPPYFLNSDNFKSPNGLGNDPTSITLCATACFDIGFGPMSGTDFYIIHPACR